MAKHREPQRQDLIESADRRCDSIEKIIWQVEGEADDIDEAVQAAVSQLDRKLGPFIRTKLKAAKWWQLWRRIGRDRAKPPTGG